MTLKNKDGNVVSGSDLEGKVVALYFSAHWCPPCRGFTPTLGEFYKKANEMNDNKFEIIFVSGDQDVAAGDSYYQNDHGAWVMLDFAEGGAANQKFGVRGIPSLQIVSAEGKAVVTDARGKVASAMSGGDSAVDALFKEWAAL